MKTASILLFSIILAGCSLIPSKFDNVEFGYLSELKAVSTLDYTCDKEQFERMKFLTSVLMVYSENTLNRNIAGIYLELNSLTAELAIRENPSSAYCRLKRKNISDVADRALEVFGKRRK